MNETEKNYEDFISTVSHELRTPLTSIRGFSQTMLSSWDKLDDEGKKRFIGIIEEQSNRLIHLVENMLSVTKLNQPRANLVFNEIDIKPQIEQVISLVKCQYPQQQFEFEYKKVPAVFADKDKLQQILTNLIENSAKYSLEDKVTKIETSINGNMTTISVSNKGAPIAPSDYERIFTKFARTDNPLTRKVQGSGLGLYITKSLTEKMGGEISVASVPDTNSSELATITFTLKFPILTIEEQMRLKCNR